jgi:PKD repeat protein
MKKLLLTFTSVLTILFTQAQCQADFSYIQNGPTTVFTDLSTIQSGWSTNYSVSWLWDFGDNSTPSYQQNPIHTYSNGIYYPCLTVTFFDSTIMNSCTSIYCDSLLIGNAPPTSWDCNPVTGCYDPGTGNGQYATLAACQNACTVTPSWDCAPNTLLGCSDPGTGLGQYTTLSACQIACGVPCPGTAIISQNGNIFTANVTGGGVSPFVYLWSTGESTQSITAISNISGYCDITDANGCVYTAAYSYTLGQYIPCDSLTVTGSQYQLMISLNLTSLPVPVDYWVTTSNDGTLLGEDSMSTSHNVYNMNPITAQPYDTIITCLTYSMNSPNVMTCCVIWIWNGTSWAKMGGTTSIEEINSSDKKLIKIVDILGRETEYKSNELLFFIFDDGTIEKRHIIK